MARRVLVEPLAVAARFRARSSTLTNHFADGGGRSPAETRLRRFPVRQGKCSASLTSLLLMGELA